MRECTLIIQLCELFALLKHCFQTNNSFILCMFQVLNNHRILALGFPLNSNKAMSGGAMTVNFVHTVKEKLNDALDVSETSGIIAEVSSGILLS